MRCAETEQSAKSWQEAFLFYLCLKFLTGMLFQKGFVEAHVDDGLLEVFGLKQGWHASFVMGELIQAKHIAQVLNSVVEFCYYTHNLKAHAVTLLASPGIQRQTNSSNKFLCFPFLPKSLKNMLQRISVHF